MNWWRSRRSGLVPLTDALEAVGDEGAMGTYHDEIAVSQVMGSISRSEDFDDRFRPRRQTDRYQAVLDRFRAGDAPPPVSVVRLGEMYFVADGHHRVAAARALGWTHLAAEVRRICSVAYVCSCITVADLPAKAAERQFLEEIPLPDPVRRNLWLDRPADWARLADSALAWAYRRGRDGSSSLDLADAHGLASAWWIEEVVPAVSRIREGAPTDLVDIQLYLTELARRDGVADLTWPTPHCCPDHTPLRNS